MFVIVATSITPSHLLQKLVLLLIVVLLIVDFKNGVDYGVEISDCTYATLNRMMNFFSAGVNGITCTFIGPG